MRKLVVVFVLWLSPSAAVWTAEPAPDPRALDFFETRIRPVLVEHCYECHAATAQRTQGGLLLDTRSGVRRGGDSGPAVVPGNLSESLILDALRYESFEMPPSGPLSKKVVADFERWIEMGAPDPRQGDRAPVAMELDVEAGRAFWSFQPIVAPAIPTVDDVSWPRSPSDWFVLAPLAERGMHPNPLADRGTLIRRAYFDLIGLPPAPADVAAFLADETPEAFENVIDRLLDSPRFGERWGRHWLDVARFAESTGGGRTRILRNAWRYRDYVIDSLNQDKPFDRFVVEQLAGDLLPYDTNEQRAEQLTATSFLALGPINYELQDKQLLTMEIVDEQIETVGRAFLGMTLGCARCHDHKFDPIPTRDYYALAGIFRSTQTVEHANVSNLIERPLPVGPRRQAQLDQHAQRVASVQAELQQLQSRLKSLGGQLAGVPALPDLAGIVIDDAQAQVIGDWTSSRSVPGFLGDAYLYAAGTPSGDRQVVYSPQLVSAGEYEVRIAYTAHQNRASNAAITVHHASGEKVVRVDQRRPPPLPGLFVSLGKFTFHAGDGPAVTISNRDADGNVIADAVQFLPVTSRQESAEVAERGTERGEREQQEAELADLQRRVKELQSQLGKLEKTAPPPPPLVISVQEGEQIADCPLHIRGNVRNLGEPVPRGCLSVATIARPLGFNTDESGRRELARWIVSSENPLTARVIVNRVWQHLFGHGIVRTPDNFGTTGERPTHPELLDYLASGLIADSWSLKRLIKRMMLSSAYRMSSDYDATAFAVDEQNRLLWRMHRKRLEAEPIRDAMLAVSGQLDLGRGGSLIANSVKSEFGYRFSSARRSVYMPVFRNTLHELFEVFDFADPNLVTGRRNTSTLPTQALYLMNSPFVMDQAWHAAERLLAEQGLDDAERIGLVCQRALGRPPTGAERELASRFLAAEDDQDKVERWAGFVQAIFACIDFRYVR